MLVYLSFLICFNGSSCHTTVPAERAFMGLAACQVGGEMMINDWEADPVHKGWKVTKVRCTLGARPKPEDQA